MGKTITTFKNRLIELMNTYQITQAQLADSIGVSRASVTRYINNGQQPKQDVIEALSIRYNVQITWLMGYDVPMRKELSSSQALEDAKLLDKWHRLNDLQKQAVMLTINNFLGLVHYP